MLLNEVSANIGFFTGYFLSSNLLHLDLNRCNNITRFVAKLPRVKKLDLSELQRLSHLAPECESLEFLDCSTLRFYEIPSSYRIFAN